MFKKASLAIAAYIPCWAVAHCAVMLSRADGLSLGYLIPYFKQAWIFSADELPSFIWVISLVLYALLLAFWLAISWWRRGSAA